MRNNFTLKNCLKIISLVIIGIMFFTASFADDFIKEYCRQDSNNPLLSTCTNWKNNMNTYKEGNKQFVQECLKRGYQINKVGPVVPLELVSCSRFLDAEKTCFDSGDCASGWCKPLDQQCQENCTGTCSGINKPGECDPVQKISEIKAGKAVSEDIGGKDCSGRTY